MKVAVQKLVSADQVHFVPYDVDDIDVPVERGARRHRAPRVLLRKCDRE